MSLNVCTFFFDIETSLYVNVCVCTEYVCESVVEKLHYLHFHTFNFDAPGIGGFVELNLFMIWPT